LTVHIHTLLSSLSDLLHSLLLHTSVCFVDFCCIYIFSIVNTIKDFKKKENIPYIIDEKGEINTDDRIKAELINTFFQSVFTVEVDS
jgi:hypothetical protein